MPTALDQPTQALQPANVGWVNPPADVTNAIAALKHQCEAWPKTTIDNPFHIVSGSEDAICRAVTGHALFVPDDLGNSIMQIGAFMVAGFILVAIALVVLTGIVFRLWAKYRRPSAQPKPAKSPIDALTAVIVLIGWFGWLSASGIASQYHYLGWGMAFLAAAAMWIYITPYMTFLIRNKSA